MGSRREYMYTRAGQLADPSLGTELTGQVPDEDVAIRSVSIASDGGTLVAGNDLVSCLLRFGQSSL